VNAIGAGLTPKLFEQVSALEVHHRRNCDPYDRLVTVLWEPRTPEKFWEFFPMHVGVFKRRDLASVPVHEVQRIYRSSGTRGPQSKIFLSRENIESQARASKEAWEKVLGRNRLPMVILDVEPQLGQENRSASLAAALAIARFGKDIFWALDSFGELRLEKMIEWMERYHDNRKIMFGFTHAVYSQFVANPDAHLLDFSKTLLIHGGGWKKMEAVSMPRSIFYQQLKEIFNFSEIIDYYGMVEQLGTIWIESQAGLFRPPATGGAVVRDPNDLTRMAKLGEVGLVQVFSSLPTSYPGHSLLLDDLGSLEIDDSGEINLKIHGRLPSAPTRGCSDAAK
jgi:hypothetical protein